MRSRLTLDEFVSRSKIKHGNQYDYSKVDYQGLYQKVIILCPAHGEFLQSPGNHLAGYRCKACATTKKTYSEYINQCKTKYGDKFDYSLVDQTSFDYYSQTFIPIICNAHGQFTRTAKEHLHGKAPCPFCGQENKSRKLSGFDFELFVADANNKYSNKFEYLPTSKKQKWTDDLTVVCPDHGPFVTSAASHLKRSVSCVPCYRVKQLTPLNEWINSCMDIHKAYYDYSKVNYTGYEAKVEINCPKHGVFWQRANMHKSGARCPRCAKGGSSWGEQLWLDSLNIPRDPAHRQVWICLDNSQKIKVDGFDAQTNTVFEYLGDYYHGNPKLFQSQDTTYFGKTFGELYESTCMRLHKIQKSGFTLVSIWASDFKCRPLRR
jgi:hypothetical protein